VKRVEQVFEMHALEVKGVDCPGIDDIIKEANDIVGEVDDKRAMDAALIAAAQARRTLRNDGYGTLIAWAKQLGHSGSGVNILEENLQEEKAADKKLTGIAEQQVNPSAV
jgi:ferritin-like metal-binding protein YciE